MNAAPPKIEPANEGSRPAGFRLAAILLGSIAVGVGVLVFFFNPTTHGFYPVCQFHRLTGLNCPGCGMTRALYALLHGDFKAAWQDNALLVAAVIALPVRVVWLAVNKKNGRPAVKFFPGTLFWPLLVVALIFTILRNLPAFAFLSPP